MVLIFQIIFWNLKMKMLLGVLPSLGGYVYAAKTSPLDPGKKWLH